MYREMLIQMNDDMASVAVMEDHQLAETYLEKWQEHHLIGNIYKGRVENVLPGMQAAFVDIGLQKNSFLYVEDALPPRYMNDPDSVERHQIEAVLKHNQEVLVQIFKEPLGNKGARVTMYPTLPGRFLVLMPQGDYVAVSRRIESEADRNRLKELVGGMLPDEMGAIVRTVALQATEEEIAEDLRGLLKLWRRIQARAVKVSAPGLVHRDIDMLERVIRDANGEDLNRIVVDSQETYEHVQGIIQRVAPSLKVQIVVREGEDIFASFGVYDQINKALSRKVWLKSGGYVIFDQTEALMAVDVNTGKYVGETDLNRTVLKTNIEAAVEVARQLRLRNIGGIVIIDFIDMDDDESKQKLLTVLEEELKKDRTRVTLLGLTQLGLVELTRKKVGHSLSSAVERECPVCDGKGRVLSAEMLAEYLEQQVLEEAEHCSAATLLVEAEQVVLDVLRGKHNEKLHQLEARCGKKLLLRSREAVASELLVRGYEE
ncbi:MAG: Rne/Rng family ribonuclease [Firmicutes bacterium]|nr:Rne/Rng family ribonuclease [Bacillota bacterium]